ncbi:hypothetical protein AWE51_03250 [Aquimarina aggregata]|uniref:Pentapeptide repeat-containing protein n=1 Tax=Aquimarina aggregata TaxID=1642818 RepID=A0A163CJ77_9FLAO|nr:pentapeptide repeat-containing protein [Aquimarina aggregata]KZS42472.1 hypothetical protein AWE51_03250 [Aquimarina aggregata]
MFFKRKILKKCDFSYADLQNTTIQNAYLNEAKLSNSSFKGAKIFNSDFKFAGLSGSDFSSCLILESNFKQSFLANTTIKNSLVRHSNFDNAEMLRANIYKTSFRNSNIKGVNFRNSILYDIDFICVDIGKSIYVDSRKSIKDSDDFFSKPRSTNTSFENVRYMNKITVDRKDWLNYAKDSLKIKGLDNLTITTSIGDESDNFGHIHDHEGKKIEMFILSVEDSLDNKINDLSKGFFGN